MVSQPCILVVEDDDAIRRGQADALRYAGYEVLESDNGTKGLEMAIEAEVDLVLLDLMLPGLGGFEVLEQLRVARPTLPVIIVTARGAEDDRVRGLRDGADDYVVKPFSARELLARVEAVLRRSPERPADIAMLQVGSGCIDLQRREVRGEDGTIRSVSQREADILRYLAANRERAIDRRELLHRVWGLNPRGLQTRTVDMQIARLRDKLQESFPGTSVILTVRSKGYMLADDVEAHGESAQNATS
ncbi:MAG: response regulator transcription factor [Planctomycetota bacterium]|jgi:DNA-binding response OmpR family regulator